ncbi:DNA/RNA polymerase [Hypoxylon sp. FL1284]|nr:DNA/RNA polymerase [Hypoxylon sp. FL1284]
MKTTPLRPGLAKPIARRAPRMNDDRIILHFDYDCFYASVFENANPTLKGLPLGVKQKSILATCNYAARARGVKKLMLISEAQKVCPDLVILNGEDLTPFRDASKKLWSMLRSHSWNGRVERLGLDEVFLDVTDVIAYNAELLNLNALQDSFFQLSQHDPEKGFSFDGSRFSGCVMPPLDPQDVSVILENLLGTRLMLASHLGGYLRRKLEEDFGYTSSGGISTNKVLAKLAGSVNKPKNQTTLLSTREEDVQVFVDGHKLRQIPGIGFRTAQLIQDHVLGTNTTAANPHDYDDQEVTAGRVRRRASMSADQLDRILDRPGAERGSGDRVWGLLHGVDAAEVKRASDVPAQISVEDTYMARPLNAPAEITRELHSLAASLVRRMRVDLTVVDDDIEDAADPKNPASQKRWAAYPRTLRLSTRARPKPGSAAAENFSRSSRSQPLPSFVLNLRGEEGAEAVAARLVAEALLPLFRRLNPERHGWNLALINVCVTNMVAVAGADAEAGGGGGASGGRNIASMFRSQEGKLREWTVYDTSPAGGADSPPGGAVGAREEQNTGGDYDDDEAMGELSASETSAVSLDSDVDDLGEQEICPECGHSIPTFALLAHGRFHAAGD